MDNPHDGQSTSNPALNGSTMKEGSGSNRTEARLDKASTRKFRSFHNIRDYDTNPRRCTLVHLVDLVVQKSIGVAQSSTGILSSISKLSAETAGHPTVLLIHLDQLVDSGEWSTMGKFRL